MDYDRLGERIRTRREALGLTQAQAASSGGVSLPVWGVLERAERDSYRTATYRAVERALGWSHGSVEAILAGGEPTIAGATLAPAWSAAEGVVSASTEARVAAVEAELAEIRRMLERVVPPESEAPAPPPPGG